MKQLILIFFIAGARLSLAQGLVEPLKNAGAIWFPKHHDCLIIDMAGNEIEGKVVSGRAIKSSPRSIKVADIAGNKIKLSADQIKSAKIKASDLIKFAIANENLGSIEELTKANWKDIINSEFLFYEHALAPKKKKDKSYLYQLLNPGFDSKIKIFHNPFGSESGGSAILGVQVTGGEEKSYLLVKNGQKSFKVKKGNYKKLFMEIYGDCPAMVEAFGNKIKFDDLAGHVFAYDRICK